MLFVRGNDALHQGMPDHVAFLKLDNRDAIHTSENASRLEQTRMFMPWQIDLRGITSNHGFGMMAEPGQKHEHLLSSRVLRFIEDNERIVQGASAHVSQGSDLDCAALGMLLDFLKRQHVIERIL